MTSDELRAAAIAAGAEERWVTGDGYTRLPRVMLDDLRLGSDGGHVWFIKGRFGWEAWPEKDLAEMLAPASEAPSQVSVEPHAPGCGCRTASPCTLHGGSRATATAQFLGGTNDEPYAKHHCAGCGYWGWGDLPPGAGYRYDPEKQVAARGATCPRCLANSPCSLPFGHAGPHMSVDAAQLQSEVAFR